ncbi:MAG: ABC transporter permease, partial [Proteobacteria bacterium]|nr:ABC transporter permease [Pseudomonadota bacterium]
MFDIDNWREVWATLRSNRLRTFLTAFGVFWGIFMLMLMLGFGSSIESGSRRQMKGMATNLLFCWGQATSEMYDGLPPGRQVKFNTDDISILRRLPGVEYLAPRLQLGGWMNNFLVSYESKNGTFTVMADYPELRHIVSFEYEVGRFINDRDITESRKIAVLGRAVRDELFGPDVDPVGKYVKISGVYFQVVGVTKTLRTGQQGDRDAHSIFVPFTTLKTSFNMGDRVGFFAMTAKPGVDGAELERQVRDALGRHHHIAPTDQLAIGSFNMFEMFGKMSTFFTVLALMSWIVGGATLAAGVVGVSNIMLITVKERTKEIGVRKALGATTRAVQRQFFLEGFCLTMLSGAIGFAVAAGLCAIVNTLPMPARFQGLVVTWQAGLLALGVLVVIGVVT